MRVDFADASITPLLPAIFAQRLTHDFFGAFGEVALRSMTRMREESYIHAFNVR